MAKKYAPRQKRELFNLIDDVNVKLGDIDTRYITDMSELFLNTKREDFSGIESWNTENVSSMRAMFYNATFFDKDISKWNTSNVLDMQFMFKEAVKFNQDIGSWNVKKVMDMSGMFEGAKDFNQDLSLWSVDALKYKENMFKECPISTNNKIIVRDDIPKTKEELDHLVNILEIDLRSIDTRYITDMSHLFANSTRKDFSGIEAWNTENVTTMAACFQNAKHFNVNISKWNTSRVVDMSEMFESASEFNQDIGSWNTENVKTMRSMFKNAINFNQALNNWNVSNVADMSFMFYNAHNFNQNLDRWKVENVKDMYKMFEGAKNFNHSIFSWNLKNITLQNYIFGNYKVNREENLINDKNTIKDFFIKVKNTIFGSKNE